MTVWQRRDDWVGTQAEDHYVMINLDVGTYIALNATAAAVWELLVEPLDEDALVAGLVGQFSVDLDECRSAVKSLLATMHEQQLVRPVAQVGQSDR